MIKAATDIRLWPDDEVEVLAMAVSTYREVAENYKAAWGRLINRVANELVRRQREKR